MFFGVIKERGAVPPQAAPQLVDAAVAAPIDPDETTPPGEIRLMLDPPLEVGEARRLGDGVLATEFVALRDADYGARPGGAYGAVIDYGAATTNAAVWCAWNASASATSTISSYDLGTGGMVWTSWVDDQEKTLHYARADANRIRTVSASNTDNTLVWGGWLDEQTARFDARARVQARELLTRPYAPPETAEERTARLAREELVRQERAVQEAKRREMRTVAIGRADKLLESVLTHAQREQLDTQHWFLLRGQSGKVYRIRKGRSANVDIIDEKTGEVVDVLCAYPAMDVPDSDTMAAQKLMLEANEAAFLKMAIRHRRFGPAVPIAAVRALVH